MLHTKFWIRELSIKKFEFIRDETRTSKLRDLTISRKTS